jgi:paraquat-inducible protein A
MPEPIARLKACHCCGLVQRVPPVPMGHRARCARCGTTVRRPAPLRSGNEWSGAAAWTALLLFPFGILLPVLEVRRFGQSNEASIWEGTLDMLAGGELLVGSVILLCSIVIPFVKLVGLITITGGRALLSRRRRALTWRLLEVIGRWGMVDVLLVALVVAIVKLGDVVEMRPGPGVLAFTACVALSLVSSALFDPHALWERE